MNKDINAYTARHSTQIQEVINRNTLVSTLIVHGYNVFLPVYDAGIDFVVHHETEDKLYKVQLKGRWTIDKKYIDRDIHIAFRDASDGAWYLMPHGEMVELGKKLGYTETDSWKLKGTYHVKGLSKALKEACDEYKRPSAHAISDEQED
jgi:hypothetical protein